jgi:hypothetical protein
VSEVTLFWSLYKAGLNGGFGAAAELIADECEYVMMPTIELSRGKPAVLKTMGRGAGAFDRTRPPKITFDAATSDWGAFEFVNEGTVASGPVESSTSLRTMAGSFLQSPALSSAAHTGPPSAWCTTSMPSKRYIGSMNTQMSPA